MYILSLSNWNTYPHVSWRYVLLNPILYKSIASFPIPKSPQIVMAGKGSSEAFFCRTSVPWGFSLYFIVHLMICQMTKPKQSPLTQYFKNALIISLILHEWNTCMLPNILSCLAYLQQESNWYVSTDTNSKWGIAIYRWEMNSNLLILIWESIQPSALTLFTILGFMLIWWGELMIIYLND